MPTCPGTNWYLKKYKGNTPAVVMAGPRNSRPGADPRKNSVSTRVTVRVNKHSLHKPACHEVLTRLGALWTVAEVNWPEHTPLSPTSSHRCDTPTNPP